MYKNTTKLGICLAVILSVFIVTPARALAADCYIVSAAGSTVTNGTYTNIGDSATVYAGTGYAGIDAFGLNGLLTGPILVVTGSGTINAYELRGFTSPGDYGDGYYYNNAGAGGSYTTINTVNAQGSSPVPTIVLDDCSDPTPPSGTSTVYYVDNPTQDLFYGYILFLAGMTLIIWIMRGRKTH